MSKALRKFRTYRQGATDYDVVWEMVEDTDLGRKHFAGCIDYNDCIITIAHPRPAQKTVSTLVHEAIHAMAYDREIESMYGETADERIVNQLAEALTQSLRDNKKLWQAMLDEL